MRSFENWETSSDIPRIFSNFRWGIIGHVTYLDLSNNNHACANHISRARYNRLDVMVVKAMKILELQLYPVIQFLIKCIISQYTRR